MAIAMTDTTRGAVRRGVRSCPAVNGEAEQQAYRERSDAALRAIDGLLLTVQRADIAATVYLLRDRPHGRRQLRLLIHALRELATAYELDLGAWATHEADMEAWLSHAMESCTGLEGAGAAPIWRYEE